MGSRNADGFPCRTSPAGDGEAAFFDVDGTVVSTHIVHQYLHVREYLAKRNGRHGGVLLHRLWRPLFYVGCVKYLLLDRVSRTRMNIAFYRNYAGLEASEVRASAEDCFERVLKPNLYEEALRCVHEHLASRRRIVLVTGSVDFLVRPLARFLSDTTGSIVELLARTLTESNGRLTGELDGPPMGEHVKAEEIRRFAARAGIDLSCSYAYGDSAADIPMLELVGHPTVVNPDRRLARKARACGWPFLTWAARHVQA